MIEFDSAIKMIINSVSVLPAENVAVSDVVGRILAQDIVSPVNVSGFRNSAMDGFAIRAELLENCSESSPITLPVVDVVYAGASTQDKVAEDNSNQALKIMTGAAVPNRYDTVVKVEDVTFTEESVTFIRPAKNGANVRPAGEDLSVGETVFRAGHRFTALEPGMLASMGLATVSLHRRPRVSVFTTGDELVAPGTELQFGQIYNSNRYTIAALIQTFCERIEHSAPVGDTEHALRGALDSDNNSDIDMLITSGGVSAGDKDLVPPVSSELGWEEMFHKIAMKPGKPVFFAKRGAQLLLGLPGNPLSTAVTCATLVIPALKKMCGYRDYLPKPVAATLKSNSRSGKRMLLWPGKIRREGSEFVAEYSTKKSSASLTALLNSDGLIIERKRKDKTAVTNTVDVLFWDDLLR